MSLSIEKLREKVCENVSDCGFSGIQEIVDMVPAAKLRREYYFLDEEE